jgi:predicted AlkP superfamily phosphohydrolase/phosphomutase
MKTIVLGLDGGTFSLLEPFSEKGYLPNISHLLKQGAKGILKSVYPAITAPAWVSFMTGLLPDKHGIFDFIDHSQETAVKRVIAASRIQAPPFWNLAGECQKRVIILNVPITYPPYPVNGVMLTGMLTPSLANVFTYPPELGPSLLETLGSYYINIPWRKYLPSAVSKYIYDLTEATRARTKYLRHLMETQEWDLTVAIFTEVDSIQHALWCYLDEFDGRDILASSKGENIREKAIEYYRYLDRCIGEILEQVRGPYRLIIVSDHGFGPLLKRIHINQWLNQQNLLSYRKFRLSMERMLALTRKLAKPLDIFDWRSKLRGRARTVQYLDVTRDTIDWSKTKAFSAFRTEQGIYVNLDGRQKQGTVKSTEFDAIREETIEKLLKLEDPFTQEPIPLKAFKREDLYQGPFASFAPDILVNAYDMGYPLDDLFYKDIFELPTWDSGTGTHRTDGIFIAYGPGINEARHVEGARIIDVAPTLMYSMGLPVPNHMEGKILEDVFQETLLEKQPVEFADYRSEGIGFKGDVYTQDEEAIIKERLAGLGYLD